MSRYQPNESERYPEGILKAFGYEAGSDDVPYRVYLTSNNSKDRKGFEFDLGSGNITTVIEDIMIDRLSRYSREFSKTISGDFSYLKNLLAEATAKAKRDGISFSEAAQVIWSELSRDEIKKIIEEDKQIH